MKIVEFAVNSTSLPHVSFDIGESYAGLLPITEEESDPRKLFFWFFPSSNPKASKEIVIWLQGGPGCSSLVGLLQENGPFLWQSGTYAPFSNPYSWTNLTNVVWVDQPFGVGLSQGVTKVRDDAEAAQQFLGFWTNFVHKFSLQGCKIYVTGESYGGRWVPYLAGAMLDRNDTTNFNVKGVHLIDAVFGNFDLWVTGQSLSRTIQLLLRSYSSHDTIHQKLQQHSPPQRYILELHLRQSIRVH